jgi:hypothetical protein
MGHERCCRSGSVGYVSQEVRLRIRILLSSGKNSKKNLEFFWFVTVRLFIFETKFFFFGVLKKQDPEADPDPLVRDTDPCIRIRTKMSRIRNTDHE